MSDAAPSAVAPSAVAPLADAPPAETAAPPHQPAGTPLPLAALRADLDRVDDALHDLLMQRADVVSRIADLRAKGTTPLRAGREAVILRRLLARHTGSLPPQAVVRIWRELFAATTAMQGFYAIAVCDTDPSHGFVQLAREHFGALTPLYTHRSPAHAIGQVSSGQASVAVLPLPVDAEQPAHGWWTALLQKDDPRIHVVARLPFWSPRPDGTPRAQALVVAPVAPDPSGRDRSLLGIEVASEVSRARLTAQLTTAGLPPSAILLRRGPGDQGAHALVEVDGFVTDDDPRLSGLSRPVVLGAYAMPEGAAS